VHAQILYNAGAPTSGSQEVVLSFKFSSKSVEGFRRCEGSKIALSHYFSQSLIKQLVQRAVM